jgi:hypothetical protein
MASKMERAQPTLLGHFHSIFSRIAFAKFQAHPVSISLIPTKTSSKDYTPAR